MHGCQAARVRAGTAAGEGAAWEHGRQHGSVASAIERRTLAGATSTHSPQSREASIPAGFSKAVVPT